MRPNAARARRGIRQEAEALARRGPGRPRKDRPAPAPAPAPVAPGGPAPAPVAGAPAPGEEQGRQFGLLARALVKPVYLAVLGMELPEQAWAEWGVAGARFAAVYFPNAAAHPGYQFAAATAVLAVPLAVAWPTYQAKRAAARKAAAAEAARGAGESGTSEPARTPESPPNNGGRGLGARPAQPPHSVGGGWSAAHRIPPS